MLCKLLSTIPLIVLTVIILMRVIKIIYRLLKNKNIFDNTDEITRYFYFFPFFIMLFMVFNCVNLWKIITAVSEISAYIFSLIAVYAKKRGVKEPFGRYNKNLCDKIIMLIVMAISYSLISITTTISTISQTAVLVQQLATPQRTLS